MRIRHASALFLLPLLAGVLIAQQAAQLDSSTRSELHSMLRAAHDEIKKNYYDPHFHGVDIDAQYRLYDGKLDQVQTLNQGFAIIAAYMQTLHDSHTFFDPPPRTDVSETGFRFQMIGDEGFVTHVQPGTDAEAKLHPGDQILTYDSFKLERATFPAMDYYFGTLATTKASGLQLRAPDGSVRHEVVQHRIYIRKHFNDLGHDEGGIYLNSQRHKLQDYMEINKPRFLESGDVLIWKLPEFDQSEEEIDTIFAHKVGKHAALVLDLRNNPGGSIETLQRMVGHLFDHEVTVAALQSRKPEKPIVAKPRGNTYRGKVFVLVDSNSASCAELFARVMQLEHRGTVVGDRTLGQVMISEEFGEGLGAELTAGYGFSVTHANPVMGDGQSLEKVGVTPDVLLLPTASDLSAGRDPVLVRAVADAGSTLDPQAAAKAFPFIWPPPDSD